MTGGAGAPAGRTSRAASPVLVRCIPDWVQCLEIHLFVANRSCCDLARRAMNDRSDCLPASGPSVARHRPALGAAGRAKGHLWPWAVTARGGRRARSVGGHHGTVGERSGDPTAAGRRPDARSVRSGQQSGGTVCVWGGGSASSRGGRYVTCVTSPAGSTEERLLSALVEPHRRSPPHRSVSR